MKYESEIKIFLEINSSVNNQKSIRAIAESLNIFEQDVGLAIHSLLKTRIVKTGETGNSEGLQYYI